MEMNFWRRSCRTFRLDHIRNEVIRQTTCLESNSVQSSDFTYRYVKVPSCPRHLDENILMWG
nr:unnamed protein product [Callosobruchus analis]